MHSLTSLALLAPLVQAAVPRFNQTGSAVAPSDVVASTSEVAVSETADADEIMRLMGPDPRFPHHESASPYCTWWYDNQGGIPCEEMPDFWDITVAQWHLWNPIIAQSCGNFVPDQSYCVEAFDHPGAPAPGPTTTTRSTTTTSPPTTTTTAPGNGIETPQPAQPGMVGNCNKFHLVTSGQTCAVIANLNGITLANFNTWNPEVGSNCAGLWLDAYVCVSVVGFTPPPTTTAPGNGVQTPQPIQPGMVNNCNRFHLVESGNTCATITSRYGITVAQFASWNTQIGGAACTGLWLDVYVCVGTVGFTPPPPTTTAPGNGIQTPQPTQPGMVTNCNRFHMVQSGNTCASIASSYGISVAQFTTWNTQVGGAACTGLWANVNVCVGIIGFTPPPTTTTPPNGIQTPSPIQNGMTPNCRRFHFVAVGQTCQVIASQYSISLAQFTRWNPAVGSNCAGLWANTYACVQGP